ncbi:MAG: radical SAM protein [Pseudomonadota bacterium]|nr:radical SAM protein [Pseudomonadota bacterium]
MKKLSAELFNIPLDEQRYLIYAPLRRAAFIGNAYTVNALKPERWETDLASDAALLAFLRQTHIIDGQPETLPISTVSGEPLPTAITLLLTTACTLRCSYCYASAGETQVQYMPLETAKRGIDFIAANAVKKNFIAEYTGRPLVNTLDVAYHGGGEPTAHWRVLTESFAYAQHKAAHLGLHVQGHLISNGVLRNEHIDWIIANISHMMVSFDGLPSIQDSQRRTQNGRASSAAVMHTLQRFDAAQFPYTIRLTATEAYLAQLPQAVAFIGAHFKPQCIQVEPAYPIGRGHTLPSAHTSRFIDAFRAARRIAKQWQITLDYSPARLDRLSNHFCGMTQDGFSLSAQGNVSACYSCFAEDHNLAEVFFYGQPDKHSQGYVFNRAVLDKLRNWALRHLDFCQDCFAQWHCAGDCYYNALNVNEPGQFSGSERCHITRELIKDELLSRITASGGRFWHQEVDNP